ncbi:MAG: T9SS type A sorting domain-containing protein [Ignavibacteriaceae bacterium]
MTDIKSQAVYDTLYLFPDTTTFNDDAITVVEEILNLAVKFTADSGWENYEIQKLLIMQPNNIDTNGFDYIFISTGEQPEETVLNTIKIYMVSTFPEEREILIDPPVKINNSNCFYLSGGGLMTLSISDWHDEAIPGEYKFWYLSGEWIEYVPTYFYLKVVVKKNLTGIDETPYNPTNFRLEQNYPNPFNPSTIISWQSPVFSHTTIKVFDILGNEVATLLDEEKPAGEHKVEFDASKYNLSSGVYFCELKMKGGNSSRIKMVFVMLQMEMEFPKLV